MKILVVDDEKDIRDMLYQGFLAEGYECMTAESGYAAINIMPDFKPKVMITDYQMPGLNGIDLLKFVNQQFPETKVIMLTGHAELEIAIDAVNLGAYAFFRKPLNLQEIKTTLGQIKEELKVKHKKDGVHQGLVKEFAKLRAANDALIEATNNFNRSK